MKPFLSGLFVVAAMAAVTPAMAQTETARVGRPQATVSEAEFVANRTRALRAADTNNDGQVTPEERRAQAEARRASRLETRFAALDKNNDGMIDRQEFAAQPTGARPHAMRDGARRGQQRMQGQQARQHHARTIEVAAAEQKARETFAKLDTDRDGQVTSTERQAARQQAREQARQHGQTRREARGEARRAAQASPAAPVSE